MEFLHKMPEECGVPSSAIKRYLEILEENNLSTHSIIIARGNNIIFEKYYPPFDKDTLHRQYSITKSYVSLAAGFAEQDGLLSIHDPLKKYFPEECAANPDPMMGEQELWHILTMSAPKRFSDWFKRRTADRVLDYFEHTKTAAPLGSAFQYEGAGSFVLGALIERLTGMRLEDYLREKLFRHIGASEDIKILRCPGGHSWVDSAMLSRSTDLLRTVRFLLDGGRVDGKQLLNEEFVKNATSNLTDTRRAYGSHGYGYLIWRTHENSFFLNGMGCQFAIGCPDKDMIFVINSDNQGIDNARDTVIGEFFKTVYAVADEPMAMSEDYAALCEYADGLSLWAERGGAHSPTEERIDGRTFVLEENKMGIKHIRLSFGERHGVLEYTNAQGEKSIAFGMCRNVFGVFPEEGYSREVGSVPTHGNYYKCAASASWRSDSCLSLTVQIIDEYLGRCVMSFEFDGDNVHVSMKKAAEDFLQAYSGEADGKCI